MYLQACNLGQN